jgi:hypothetical protein
VFEDSKVMIAVVIVVSLKCSLHYYWIDAVTTKLERVHDVERRSSSLSLSLSLFKSIFFETLTETENQSVSIYISLVVVVSVSVVVCVCVSMIDV